MLIVTSVFLAGCRYSDYRIYKENDFQSRELFIVTFRSVSVTAIFLFQVFVAQPAAHRRPPPPTTGSINQPVFFFLLYLNQFNLIHTHLFSLCVKSKDSSGYSILVRYKKEEKEKKSAKINLFLVYMGPDVIFGRDARRRNDQTCLQIVTSSVERNSSNSS